MMLHPEGRKSGGRGLDSQHFSRLRKLEGGREEKKGRKGDLMLEESAKEAHSGCQGFSGLSKEGRCGMEGG